MVTMIGNSQGASGLNELVMQSLPLQGKLAPQVQWFHLSGPNDAARMTAAYRQWDLTAVVHPFFEQMDLVLGAATAAISRAGASSLAELAAVRLPSVLLTYPAATENHQFHNARALASSGAAHLLEQKQATPERLASLLMELLGNPAARQSMRAALAQWHAPKAAETIAERMLQALSAPSTLDALPACPQPYRINA